MWCRAVLIATAAIATAAVGWRAPANAQSPVAAATTVPISPVISADYQYGDGWEWSKTVLRCIPAPTAAATACAGRLPLPHDRERADPARP